MVMDRMGWSWSDLQQTPVDLVEHLVEQMKKESKQSQLPRAARRRR
jgi:hypothetical protein